MPRAFPKGITSTLTYTGVIPKRSGAAGYLIWYSWKQFFQSLCAAGGAWTINFMTNWNPSTVRLLYTYVMNVERVKNVKWGFILILFYFFKLSRPSYISHMLVESAFQIFLLHLALSLIPSSGTLESLMSFSTRLFQFVLGLHFDILSEMDSCSAKFPK